MTDNVSKEIESTHIVYDNNSTGPTFVNLYGAVMPPRKIPPVNIWPSEVNVDLGNIGRNSFHGVGDTAAAKGFKLKLSGFPKSEKHVYITFNGAFSKEHPAYFAHANSEEMGVSVVISDVFSLPHTPAVPGSILGPYPLVDGEATIDLLAIYIATRDAVSSGTVNLAVSVHAYTQSQLTA